MLVLGGRRDGDVCTLAYGVDCTTELRCTERTMTETLEPWEAGRTMQTLVAQVARRELVVARPGVLTWGVEGSHAVSRLSILDSQLRTRPPPHATPTREPTRDGGEATSSLKVPRMWTLINDSLVVN